MKPAGRYYVEVKDGPLGVRPGPAWTFVLSAARYAQKKRGRGIMRAWATTVPGMKELLIGRTR
jgi:hypothetical protein